MNEIVMMRFPEAQRQMAFKPIKLNGTLTYLVANRLIFLGGILIKLLETEKKCDQPETVRDCQGRCKRRIALRHLGS